MRVGESKKSLGLFHWRAELAKITSSGPSWFHIEIGYIGPLVQIHSLCARSH